MAKKKSKKPCSICGRTRVAKGLCSKCYREKYGVSYKPKQHRVPKGYHSPHEYVNVLDVEAEKNAKAIQESALKMAVSELSDRCEELSTENKKLREDLELTEYSYNERFNEMEIEQLRIKANAWDLLFSIMTKGVKHG
jgi:hypothetical protein